ncbi:MAG: hypothetical protein V4584_14200 [Verrucomicrobiota bacterium]
MPKGPPLGHAPLTDDSIRLPRCGRGGIAAGLRPDDVTGGLPSRQRSAGGAKAVNSAPSQEFDRGTTPG